MKYYRNFLVDKKTVQTIVIETAPRTIVKTVDHSMHSLGNTDSIIMKAEYEQTTLDASDNLWFKHFNQKMDCCHVIGERA